MTRWKRKRERDEGPKERIPECLFEFLAKWPSVRSAGHPSQPAGVRRNHTDLHIMIYILVLSASSTLPPLALIFRLSSSSLSLPPSLQHFLRTPNHRLSPLSSLMRLSQHPTLLSLVHISFGHPALCFSPFAIEKFVKK